MSPPIHSNHELPSSSPDPFESFMNELIAAPVKPVLEVDSLLPAHPHMSASLGAISIKPLSTVEDDRRAISLRDLFLEYVRSRYPEPDTGYPGGLQHAGFKEILHDGSEALSVLLELRNKNGKCMLGNSNCLYEAEGGPVLLWVREQSEGLMVRAIYSEEAFRHELLQIKNGTDSLFQNPDTHPLALSVFLESVATINRTISPPFDPLQLENLMASDDLPLDRFRFKNGEGELVCQITCNPETRGLGYHIIIPVEP